MYWFVSPPLPPCLYFWWFCPVLSTSFLTAPFNHTIFNLRHLVRSGYFYKGRVLWPTAAYYSCSLDPYFHFHVAAHTSVTQVKLMINALIIALWILVPILFWELLCIHPFSAMIVEDWGGGESLTYYSAPPITKNMTRPCSLESPPTQKDTQSSGSLPSEKLIRTGPALKCCNKIDISQRDTLTSTSDVFSQGWE